MASTQLKYTRVVSMATVQLRAQHSLVSMVTAKLRATSVHGSTTDNTAQTSIHGDKHLVSMVTAHL